MNDAKVRFSNRNESLPSLGIKNMTVSGTETLIFYQESDPDSINRNVYPIVYLPNATIIAVANTRVSARKAIEKIEALSLDWNAVIHHINDEENRFLATIRTLKIDGLIK